MGREKSADRDAKGREVCEFKADIRHKVSLTGWEIIRAVTNDYFLLSDSSLFNH